MARALLLISALAAISCAAAQICSSDNAGSSSLYQIDLPAVTIPAWEYNLETRVREACESRLMRPVGVVVSVCSATTPPPVVHVTSLDCAYIKTTSPASVHVTGYCLPYVGGPSPQEVASDLPPTTNSHVCTRDGLRR